MGKATKNEQFDPSRSDRAGVDFTNEITGSGVVIGPSPIRGGLAAELWRRYYGYVPGASSMQRTTIMLPRDLKQRAAREARSRGVSLGELIREALASLLRSDPEAAGVDPMIGDTAVYDGPVPADTSERHDEQLYGRSKRR
jgi:hypothetical protein